jgi:hypothetical protein
MFKILLDQLSKSFVIFYLNNYPITRIISDCSFIGKDKNFRKQIELNLNSRFMITLKQGDLKPYNISGSLYSIEKLITTLLGELIIANEKGR